MVKRIKRTNKGLVLTTSPCCYWSIRVNLYNMTSWFVASDEKWIEKHAEAVERRDFSQCKESTSKRRKVTVEQQINNNLTTSSVEEDLVRILYYLYYLMAL